MRRIAMGLCALAMLCQMLVLPVMAAPAAASGGNNTGFRSGSTVATDEVVIPGQAGTAITADSVKIEEDGLVFTDIDAEAKWTINVPKTGWYKVMFTYSGVEGIGGSADMELGLKLDGAYPFAEAENFVLPRTWKDVAEDYNGDGTLDQVREDTKGNQFAPEQEGVFEAKKSAMRDVNGFVTEDLCMYLTEELHRF